MADNRGKTVGEILKGKKAGIKRAPLEKGSPSWDDILDLTWEESRREAAQRAARLQDDSQTAQRETLRQMKKNQFKRLLTFLERLDQERIPYSLRHSRDDALMVVAFAPGEYWEIDFLERGEIEIERFRSNGKIEEESALEQLFALCSDEEPAADRGAKTDDAVA